MQTPEKTPSRPSKKRPRLEQLSTQSDLSETKSFEKPSTPSRGHALTFINLESNESSITETCGDTEFQIFGRDLIGVSGKFCGLDLSKLSNRQVSTVKTTQLSRLLSENKQKFIDLYKDQTLEFLSTNVIIKRTSNKKTLYDTVYLCRKC